MLERGKNPGDSHPVQSMFVATTAFRFVILVFIGKQVSLRKEVILMIHKHDANISCEPTFMGYKLTRGINS